MKILLVCNAGMSSGLLVNKMLKESQARERQDEIACCSVDELEQQIGKYDVLLLGPQIRYQAKGIGEMAAALGKACAVIDSVSYGMVDGKRVLDQALSLGGE